MWPVLCEQTADPKEKSLEEKVTLQQVGELFNSLPDKQKAVIEAIYIEGKSQQEVADELNIPLGTVKSRTRLALQRLKDMLETHD
jgi:RNA polymerase sigma-70 factor (ECF subfamily)